MEEEQKDLEPMEFKRPRKLDLNAPLLSTRRLGSSSDAVADTSCSSKSFAAGKSANERVPFSWELSAGKAKDVDRSYSMQDEEDTPPLSLPPSLWHPLHPPQDQLPAEPEADVEDELHDQVDNQDDGYCGNLDNDDGNDEGCYGNLDNDDGNDEDSNNGVLSDAVDVISLSEALDIVQNSEKPQNDNSDMLRLKIAQGRGNESSDYIIKRFLPDATALAESSALRFDMNMDKKVCSSCRYPEAFHAATARGSYAESPKGCGLDILFPWRMKQKLCAVKSPMLHCSTNLQKHRHGSKQKK